MISQKGRNVLRVAFLSLGCKVNYYETEKMKGQLAERGHAVVPFEEEADIYIVNTCTVTNIADRKSRKMLHRARRMNGNALVVAAGCYVDSARKRGETDGSVDFFIGNEEKDRLVEILEEALREREGRERPGTSRDSGKSDRLEGPEDQRKPERSVNARVPGAAGFREHTRAYLKVQDGCNQYCTYCIIPYVRGPLASKPEGQVVAEVEELASQGVREVVLTGIHLSSYGVDFTEKKSFLELEGKPLLSLIQAVGRVPGIRRIRLGSLEPRIITHGFAEELAGQEKVCPHFHLSLQSGCDGTLKRMNRHYSAAEYLEKLEILRKYFVRPAVTTDIIVGFPGETEEEFAATCAFAQRAGFAKIHVFKYSRRQGTMADAMEGQVPEQVKAERSDRLIQIGRELERAYGMLFLGQDTRVLLEEITQIQGQDFLVGYNERYVRVAIPAGDREEAERLCNQIVPVRIAEQGQDGGEVLFGRYGRRSRE